MTHCGEKWVDMIERTPEVCDMTEDYRRKIDRWIHTCNEIISRGFDRKIVFKKFPEGAHRELPDEEDPMRSKALNYICECLKRDEKITGSDLKKSITVWEGKNKTIVGKSTPDHDVRGKTLPTITNKPAHEPAPAAQTPKDKYGGKDEQVKPPAVPVEKKIPACLEGRPCPDRNGKNHLVREKLRGQCCGAINIPINQLPNDECPLEADLRKRQAAAASAGTFTRASGTPSPTHDPATGGKLIKTAGVKIVPVPVSQAQAAEWLIAIVRGYLTPKQQEIWEDIRKTGELGDTDLEIFQGLIDEAGERVG